MTDAPVIARTNLLGLERSGMESFVQELGHKPSAPASCGAGCSSAARISSTR